MGVTGETVAVLVFLIPGFISSLILNAILVRKTKGNLLLIVEALALSLLVYTVASFITSEPPISLVVSETGGVPVYLLRYNWRGLLPVAVVSICLPLLIGASVTHDWHMRFLRLVRVTDKTARSTIWQDVFTDQKRYVVVNLSDGRRVFGWPMYYSDTPEEGQIYLYDAAWIVDDHYQELDGHGIFLVRSEQIESIEFTHITEQEAIRRQKRGGEDGQPSRQ